MNPFRNIVLMLGLLLASVTGQELRAQTGPLQRFIAMMDSTAVELSYRYSVKEDGTELQGSGTVELQGISYHLQGDGLEIWCNGESRWTVDGEAREVVIEDCSSATAQETDNPVLLVRSIGQLYRQSSCVSAVRDGEPVQVIELEAVDPSFPFRHLSLQLSADSSRLLQADFKMKNGTAIEIAIPSFSFRSLSPLSRFNFDAGQLDSSYIVTDLR